MAVVPADRKGLCFACGHPDRSWLDMAIVGQPFRADSLYGECDALAVDHQAGD